MWNKRTRKKLTVISMELLLIISTLFVCLLVQNMQMLSGSVPDWGKHRFPIFYLEEPFLYANYREEQFIVLNNSDYQQLQLLGDFAYKNDDFREPLAKYNNYLFQFKREHYFGEIPEDINFIEIINVSDHTNPQLIVELQLSNGTLISYGDLYVHEFVEIDNGLYFFLQDLDRNNFFVVNCTNMQQPELVDSYQFSGEAGEDFNKFHKFYIKDKTVFIPTLNATSSVGFTIYNFTTLDNLTKIGEWFGATSLATFESVHTTQEYLYLKKWGSGVEIFNIQNLTNPTRIGFTSVPGYRFFCHQEYVFGFYHATFSIYDCLNTSSAEPIFTYNYPLDTHIHHSYMSENMITDNYLYLPMDEHKLSNETLHIWDWSDPTNLTIKALLGLPTIPPKEEPLNWTDPKIIVPIAVGGTIIITFGILLVRQRRLRKKRNAS